MTARRIFEDGGISQTLQHWLLARMTETSGLLVMGEGASSWLQALRSLPTRQRSPIIYLGDTPRAGDTALRRGVCNMTHALLRALHEKAPTVVVEQLSLPEDALLLHWAFSFQHVAIAVTTPGLTTLVAEWTQALMDWPGGGYTSRIVERLLAESFPLMLAVGTAGGHLSTLVRAQRLELDSAGKLQPRTLYEAGAPQEAWVGALRPAALTGRSLVHKR
jgi:hypothetical protein